MDSSMNRRRLLNALSVSGIAMIAGCGDAEDPELGDETTPNDDEGDDEEPSTPGPGNGEPGAVDVSVHPSAEQIAYGDEYTVTVTMSNTTSVTQWFWGTIVVRRTTETWRDVASTEMVQIPPEEEREETYIVAPPRLGDLEFGLMDSGWGEVLAQWTLSVESPQTGFGETNRFYDGLAVTTDVELSDAMDMRVETDDGPETRSITAPAGMQWAVLSARVDNTSTDAVTWGPPWPQYFLRLDRVQQKEYTGDLGWWDREFEDQLQRPEIVDLRRQSGYFQPPREISAGAAAEGWLLFSVSEDASIEALDALLTRRESTAWDHVSVVWESR